MQTDEELFDLCRQREPRAWEDLVRRYQDRMLNLAFQFTGNREEALDLAQEIFVKVYQSMDHYRSGAVFRSWLYSVARNLCIDHYRRRKRRPRTLNRPVEEFYQLASSGPAPERVAEGRRRGENLLRAMDNLSEVNREAIVLREFQNLSLEDMARQLELPVGTIKSRLSRARVELAQALLRIEEPAARQGGDRGI